MPHPTVVTANSAASARQTELTVVFGVGPTFCGGTAQDGLSAGASAWTYCFITLLAISEFPKGRKYLISLSFRGKASVRPAQVGGFDVNIVIHGSTAVRGRGDLVAYRWALWKLTAPWTHRTRPPHLGKRCAFSTSSTGPFPSNHSRKTPKGPKIALGNPDRPTLLRLPARGADNSSSDVRLARESEIAR